MLLNLRVPGNQIVDNQFDLLDKYDEDTDDANWIAEEERGTLSSENEEGYYSDNGIATSNDTASSLGFKTV